MSKQSIDFKQLNDLLISHAYRLIVEFVPGGKQRHREYVAGSIYGGDGDSFSFNLDNGKWADFSVADHKGGDMVSLYAKINNISQIDSAKALCEMVGYVPNYQPQSVSLPKNIHPRHGKASGYWIYKNKKGSPTHVVMRFDPEGERKQFAQWHFDDKESKWVAKTTARVPLYKLDEIVADPNKIVAVCEGEKAADAAQEILGTTYITTCWPGGSNAVKKADLSPLFDRDVLLWPDADEPGYKCMNHVAVEIAQLAKTIKIINVKPDDKKGMDAADLKQLPKPEAKQWLKNRVKQLKPYAGGPKEDQSLQASDSVPTRKAEVMRDQPSSIGSSASYPVVGMEIVDQQLSVDDTMRMRDLWVKMGLMITKGNAPFETEINAFKILRQDNLFQNRFYYDEFHKRYYSTFDSIEPREMDDIVITKIKIYLQATYGLNKISTAAIKSAVELFLETQERKNTIAEKFSELVWDKQPRIDKFFHTVYGAPDTEYTDAVSRIFWLSLMKRACRPGVKVDTVVILEGAQGIRKSTSLELIAGKQYGVAGRDISNKDFYLKMSSKTIMEIAELNSFSKHDHNELKEVVSTATDEFRVPYGARVDAHPRSCIFVGTTNERNYLKDDTGSRRYLPVDCQKVEWDLLTENLDQYYAEAYERAIIHNENHWDYPVEMHRLITGKRDAADKEIDSWQEIISDFAFDVQRVMVSDLYTILSIPTHMQNLMTSSRIGRIMRKLGFERISYRDPDNQSKVKKCFKKIDFTGVVYEWSGDKILKQNQHQNDFASFVVNQAEQRSAYYNR